MERITERKLTSALTVVCFILLLFAVNVSAAGKENMINSINSAADIQSDSGSCGENLTWVFDDSAGTLSISGSGEMTDYSISSEAPWKVYSDQIKSVLIGSGVTSIGEFAFYGAEELESLSLSESIITIGTYAFGGCSSLKSVDFPAALNSIGGCAFYNCTKLSHAGFSEGLISLGDHAFSNCTALTAADLPDSVETIGCRAFYNCSSLSRFHYPLNWKYAPGNNGSNESYIFSNCTSLKSINITDGVTEIPENAFLGAAYLENVSFPDTLKSIGTYAFYDCPFRTQKLSS